MDRNVNTFATRCSTKEELDYSFQDNFEKLKEVLTAVDELQLKIFYFIALSFDITRLLFPYTSGHLISLSHHLQNMQMQM